MSKMGVRLLLAALLAPLVVLVSAGSASASCEGDATIKNPVDSPVGTFVDYVPGAAAAPRGDPLQTRGMSWARTYGWSSHWGTYDLGCGPDAVKSPQASFLNPVANFVLEMGKFPVAAGDQLDAYLSGNPFWWVSAVVDTLNTKIGNQVWLPIFGLMVGLIGVVVMARSGKGNVRHAFEQAVWLLLVCAVTAGCLWMAPLVGQHLTSGVRFGADAASTPFNQGRFQDTVGRRIVYKYWLEGELGSSQSPLARKYGAELYRLQHLTWYEYYRLGQDQVDEENENPEPTCIPSPHAPCTKVAGGPGGGAGPPQAPADPSFEVMSLEDRQDRYYDIADDIQHTDGDAYAIFQGKDWVKRTWVAFVMGGLTWPVMFFVVLALLALGWGMLLVWGAVIATPIASLVGARWEKSQVLLRVWNMVVAAVVGVVKLTLASAVYTTVVEALITHVTADAVLLIAAWTLAVIAVMLVRPIKTFKQMTPGVDADKSYVMSAYHKVRGTQQQHNKKTRAQGADMEADTGRTSTTKSGSGAGTTQVNHYETHVHNSAAPGSGAAATAPFAIADGAAAAGGAGQAQKAAASSGDDVAGFDPAPAPEQAPDSYLVVMPHGQRPPATPAGQTAGGERTFAAALPSQGPASAPSAAAGSPDEAPRTASSAATPGASHHRGDDGRQPPAFAAPRGAAHGPSGAHGVSVGSPPTPGGSGPAATPAAGGMSPSMDQAGGRSPASGDVFLVRPGEPAERIYTRPDPAVPHQSTEGVAREAPVIFDDDEPVHVLYQRPDEPAAAGGGKPDAQA